MRAHEYGVLWGPSKKGDMNDWMMTLFSDLANLEEHLRDAIDSDADSFLLLRYHPLTTPISKEIAYNVQGAGQLSLIPPDVYQASLNFDLWPPHRRRNAGEPVKVHKYGLLSGSPKTKDYHDWWLTLFSERDDLDEHMQTAMNSDADSFVVLEHEPTGEPVSKVVHYRVVQVGRLDQDSPDITLNG